MFRSNLDPRKGDRLLANAVLEGFHLEFGLRPFDMSVDVTLRSLYIEDKMVDDDNEFRHLVTSEKMNGDEGKGQDLVRIRYQGVQKDSPEFMTVYEGVDKVRDSVLRLDGRMLTVFDFRLSMLNFLRLT